MKKHSFLKSTYVTDLDSSLKLEESNSKYKEFCTICERIKLAENIRNIIEVENRKRKNRREG